MIQVLIVPEQKGRTANLSQDDIQITVAVDISIGGTAAHDWLEKILSSFPLRNWHKARAAGRARVPKELRGLGIGLALLNLADLLLQMAIRGEHVESAIQIVIEKENSKFQK